jgi:hypothetical protein
VVFGLTQLAILGSVLACVVYLPGYFKVSVPATHVIILRNIYIPTCLYDDQDSKYIHTCYILVGYVL